MTDTTRIVWRVGDDNTVVGRIGKEQVACLTFDDGEWYCDVTNEYYPELAEAKHAAEKRISKKE